MHVNLYAHKRIGTTDAHRVKASNGRAKELEEKLFFLQHIQYVNGILGLVTEKGGKRRGHGHLICIRDSCNIRLKQENASMAPVSS